jgi:hypothetical protein
VLFDRVFERSERSRETDIIGEIAPSLWSLEKNALLAVVCGEKRKSIERCETSIHASILIGRNKIGFEATRQRRGVKFVHKKRSV